MNWHLTLDYVLIVTEMHPLHVHLTCGSFCQAMVPEVGSSSGPSCMAQKQPEDVLECPSLLLEGSVWKVWGGVRGQAAGSGSELLQPPPGACLMPYMVRVC